jgi:hypothetical protein
LRQLTHECERPERYKEHADDNVRERKEARGLDDVLRREAMRPEEVDEVCGLFAYVSDLPIAIGERAHGEIHINVLEVQQDGEKEPADELLSLKHQSG